MTRGGRAVAVLAGGRAARRAPRGDRQHDADAALRTRCSRPAPRRRRRPSRALRFRYSPRAGMQIHVALAAPLRWRDRRLDRVPIVHLSDGLDSVSLACAQAAAGLLPAAPTIVVGQPTVARPQPRPRGRRQRSGSSCSRSPTPRAATPPARSISARAAGPTRRSSPRSPSACSAASPRTSRTGRRCGARPPRCRRSSSSGATPTSSAATSTPATASSSQSYLWRPLAELRLARDAGREPLPLRRLDLPGPGPERRLGPDRGLRAAAPPTGAGGRARLRRE